MVYDWDDKESECYRLYVEERKSLDEVIDYFKQQGFVPRYVGPIAWFAVLSYGCRRESSNALIFDCCLLLERTTVWTARRRRWLTLRVQQACVPDAVQGRCFTIGSGSPHVLIVVSGGIFRASRIPHTRMARWSREPRSYGRPTLARRKCFGS